MYNLRYHIASLVAVFLALAMGLLLGTIVVERGVLSDQQTTLVAGLQKDFDQVRSESAAVQRTNAGLTAFATQAVPRLVNGALAGQTVLVIGSPDSGETVANVTSDVRAAGGTAAVVTFSGVGLSLAENGVAAAAGKALGLPAASVDETAVVAALAREWTTAGDPRTLTKAMTAAGGLKLTGLASQNVADAVVVSAAFNGTPDPAAFALASEVATGSGPVVGVESTQHADGTAAAAKAAGLSGVDDVDSPVGAVSLVWVLAGRATGLFGAGTGVDAALPTPLFPSQ
jgi:hypothetical protein